MNNKYSFLLIILSILVISLFSCSQKEMALGQWDVLVTGTPLGDFEGTLNISMEGNELSGTVSFPGRVETTMKNLKSDGRELSFSFDSPSGYTSFVEGEIDGNEITGTLTVNGTYYAFTGNR